MTENRPLEILLVEDDPSDAALTELALKGTGFDHHLTVLNDGEAAMEYLYREAPFEGAPTPDIVLLKVDFPRIDGLAVLEEIKRMRADRQKVIVAAVLAAVDEPKIRRASAILGADAYLIKPSAREDAAALSASIRTLWERTS